jgi:hypothetical protein
MKVNANYDDPAPLTRVPKKRELKSMSFKQAFEKGQCIHCKNDFYVIEMTSVNQAGKNDIVRVCKQCFERLLAK